MKKQILNIFMVFALGITMIACKDKAKEANTNEAEAVAESTSNSVKYSANAEASVIEWKGFKPTGTHNGTVNIESGVLKTENGSLQSGTFLIDMASIVSLDLEGDYKDSLENHLKGTVEGKEGDFFNVTKFPTGAFEITGTETNEAGQTILSGNLTLKETKYNVSFPIAITNEDNTLTLSSDAFTIDRTKWGVNYKSKTIFDGLGDKFINDEIELKITIKATKA